MFSTDGPPTFPPAALAVTAAVIGHDGAVHHPPVAPLRPSADGRATRGVRCSSASPSDPERSPRWRSGTLAGSICHLVAGSPADSRHQAESVPRWSSSVSPSTTWRPCACVATVSPCYEGHDRAGKLNIKVYGRDAWDGELIASAWSHLWYRDTRHATRLGRSELVEHEGFMTFLASRAGGRMIPNDVRIDDPHQSSLSPAFAPRASTFALRASADKPARQARARMVKLALLWHMHQPSYEDLATGEHILPWVRLHAIKDYWGMVALLREFPRIRVTFDLVPSLIAQVQAFAEDRARDRHLALGLKPARRADARRGAVDGGQWLPRPLRADDRSLPALR